ncbi:MAG: class I SAM-dependent methyltransferase [Chitinophagaceae bacterium]|nr:class I SAM-dependent methyltransferase [Chitinophagaceae bacterium]
MDRYKETFETWNKLASLYQDAFMDLNIYNESYDFVCKAITPPSAKLLEIACGPGNITKYLLSVRPDFSIFGIDIAPNMIELAKKNNPAAAFAIMDIRKIDEIKTKYDGIVCGFGLPYLSPAGCPKFITDCYNLLNDGGLLYISFVEGDAGASDYQVSGTGDRSYFYFYHLNDLSVQLAENNFGDFKIFKVEYKKADSNELHTIIIAKKKTTA